MKRRKDTPDAWSTVGGERSEDPVARSYVENSAWMWRFARAVLRDSHRAQDLVQGVWVRIMHKNTDPSKLTRPFLARCINNAVIDLARRARAFHGMTLEWRHESATGNDPLLDPDPDQQERLRLLGLLAKWRESLPPRQQDVLTLWAEGNSLEEIAARLGVKYETAHTHLTRALRRLRIEAQREKKKEDQA